MPPTLLFQFAILFFFWVYKNWVAFVLTGIALRISIWNFVVVLSLCSFLVKAHKDTVISYLILICACRKWNEHSDKWVHSWKPYFALWETTKRTVSPILSLCTVGSKYPKSHLFCNNNGCLEWKEKKVVHSIFLPLGGMWLPESITAFVWWYIVRWSTLYCRNWRDMEDSFKLHVMIAQIIMHTITSVGIRWTYLLSSKFYKL